MAQRLFPALLLCSLVSQAEPLKLPTTLPSTSGYVIENALPGLTFKQPLAIASVPGEKDRLFIAEKGGQIHVVTGYPAKPVKALFLDVEQMLIAKGVGTLATDGEWGVLGLAFHPRFAETGFVFVTYAMKVKEGGKTLGFNCLSRFTVSKSNPNQADPSSELRLLAQLDPAAYHNGGDLQFGPDGYLYYSMGDGGGSVLTTALISSRTSRSCRTPTAIVRRPSPND